uniref:RNA-directed DNA polymerase n=1 Tax=Strigamia maritima TaxID=126957 RepID=T1IMC6_STRMM
MEWVLADVLHPSGDDTQLDATSKFLHLRTYLVGEALEDVKSLEITVANYLVATTRLNKKYGDKTVLENRFISNLLHLPIVNGEKDRAGYKNFTDTWRLNQAADALSRAPLSAEDIPADDHVEEKEVAQYWPNWDGNKSSLLPIDKMEEGEDEIEQEQTLYNALTDLLNIVPPTREELIEAQTKDEFCLGIRNYLLSKDNERKKLNKPPNWMEKIGGYMLDSKESTNKDGLLVYFNPTFDEELNDSGNGFKAVVPRSLIRRVMFACHDHPLSGHAGISKTLHKTKQIYYWPRMSRDIRVYVRSCQHCQQYKPNQEYVKELLDVLKRAHQNMYHRMQKNYEKHKKVI